MQNDASKKYLLLLDVKTPVHVGSGHALLKDFDFVMVGDKYYRLNPNLLIKKCIEYKIRTTRELLDKIRRHESEVQAVSSYYGSVHVSDYERLRERGIRVELNNVKEHIKSGGTPIVPGSTIKGLLRTALLYYLITRNDEILESFKNHVNRVLSSIKDMINRRRVRDVRKYIKNATLNFEQQFLKVLWKDRYLFDVLRCLLISDPQCIKYDLAMRCIAVMERSGNIAVAFPVETIDPPSRYQYSVILMHELIGRITKRLQGRPFDEISDKLNILNIIIDALCAYSLDALDFEIELLRDNFAQVRGIDRITDMLRSWKNEVERSREKEMPIFYLKVGFATGHMHKTLDLILYKNYRDLYNSLCNVMSSIYRRTWNLMTIKLDYESFKTGNPLQIGWVSISLKEEGRNGG